MKKLSIVVAALVIAGVVSSQAQVYTNIINTSSNTIAAYLVGPLPITIKGKTNIKGAAAITEATLAATAPGGGTLVFAVGYEVAALHTGRVQAAIGTQFGTSNFVSIVGTTTNTSVFLTGYTILAAENAVDLSKPGKSGPAKSAKFLSGWREVGDGLVAGSTNIDFSTALNKVVSNATILVSGTISSTGKSSKTSSNATSATAFKVSGKATGVWQDGVSTISASIGTAK